MRSRTSATFRKRYETLPVEVQQQAKKAYRQFERNPSHRSLNFKQVHPVAPIYSVRIAKGYRALGKLDEQGILWFWVGPHAEYDLLLKRA